VFVISTTLWAIQPRNRGSISRRNKKFIPLPQRTDSFWGPFDLLIPRVPRFLNQRVNRPEHETDHWPLSSTEIKNAWSYPSILPRVFALWGLISTLPFSVICKNAANNTKFKTPNTIHMLYCSARDEYEYGNKHRAYDVWLSTVESTVAVQLRNNRSLSQINKIAKTHSTSPENTGTSIYCQILISFCF
jgi:hypothetical protein